VVVTGGSGRIGRYLVRELVPHHDVLNADIADPPGADSEFVRCDVLKPEQVAAALAGARAVCHLGGLDYDTGASGEAYYRVNTIGTWNVLEAAARASVERVIVASSTSAYGLFDMRPEWTPLFLPIDETHPDRPHGGYGLSKVVTEQIAEMWARASAMKVICFRPQHVVGWETLALFDDFLAGAHDRWLHNYVVVTDVARAFALAVDEPIPHSGVFLIGADDTPREEPTLEWLERALGQLPELRDPRRYEQSPRASLFSNARAASVLGWRPVTTLAQLREDLATTGTV